MTSSISLDHQQKNPGETLGANRFMQLCLVVKDAEATMRNFMEIFGIDKGVLHRIPPPDHYRGQEIHSATKYYLFPMGELWIEITEPDDTDSVWKQLHQENGDSLAYMGVRVEDSTAAVSFLTGKGAPVVQHGGTPSHNYHILDTRASLGFMLNVKMAQIAPAQPLSLVHHTA